jgi:hypothetical protein
MSFINTTIKAAVVLGVVAIGGWYAVKWTAMRVYVDQNHAMVLINKFGDPLPPERVVVPAGHDNYKGVQEEVLGPGRYFVDPITHDWQLVDLVKIPAGNPAAWKWNSDGSLVDPATAPMVGIVSMKEGRPAAAGQTVVGPGYRGIQAAVLTPGEYKVNPFQEEVTVVPAVLIPPGFVGVQTELGGADAALSANPTTGPTDRLIGDTTHRGVRPDVLQPGIYYLNPKVVKVTIAPVGYDQITLDHSNGTAVRFYTHDGYQVEADFTLVWGRSPADVPHIVANIGDTKAVEQNVIEPAMKAACQNEGGKYTAKELIQGTTRSKFQDDLSESLAQQVESRNVHVLLALVRNISIKDTNGRDATNGLMATIQQANIEVEMNLTNQQKTATATVKANLQQALKLVDVARETVASDTNVKVANILADGQKKAAEIDADRDLQIASINLDVANQQAQSTQILGKAAANVDQMKRDAESAGQKLMVQALGSPQAYNMYTFAKGFEPTDLRLIFAGPGTFWTDLKSFPELTAGQDLQAQQPMKK